MFRFSIRELMLVTLVVALAVGWWAERSKRAARDAEWEKCSLDMGTTLIIDSKRSFTFRTPTSEWRVNPDAHTWFQRNE